ncbi:MAG: class I adenylate-forming enzyme family protein [Solirubrobacteraceae bacterium]
MLIELVRKAAARSPELPLVISPTGTLSYGDCLHRSEAVAAGLQAAGIERFGCAGLAPEEIVVAAVASSVCHAEACFYPRDLDAAGLSRFAERFGHEVVVVDAGVALTDARGTTLAELEKTEADPADAGGGAPDEESPVLILTTGTTGEQKGARHDWSRLARAVRRPDPEPTRWLLAYNLNQFAGIQIMLHVLASGSTLVAPPSRRADEVIETIRRHRVTHASATPTFWRLLVGRLDAETARDLPLRQITLGGEAAPEGLIERLHELFPDARLSHVYAGTEFGSAVSVRDGRSGLPLSVLDRDENAEVRLRIVDGELQIRSRVGMLGYHRDADDESEWRATGDLVEIRDDRIHFVGRKTEIINVGGAKVHPLPVEETVCSVPGVQLAAVYGRANAVTGQIVAVDVVPAPGVDTDELAALIRQACQALPAAGRPRRIRFVEELEIKGNKLMRREVAV